MSLYTTHRPRGIKSEWECTSLIDEQVETIMQRHYVPADWGRPTDSVGWFTEAGKLRVLVADYANGRRVTLRQNKGSWKLDFGKPAITRGAEG